MVSRGTEALPDETDRELMRLHTVRDYPAFMRLAVRARKNIVVSGATGSGKTTWTKSLIREIPSAERLVSIEDARELVLDGHPNHVRLYYSKDDQEQARVTPKQLLECCLRMRPDRILLAELRSEEAFDYLRNVNSGHPGSITSVHACSAALAFEQLTLLVKQSTAGSGLGAPRHQEPAVFAGRRSHPVLGAGPPAGGERSMVPSASDGCDAAPVRSTGAGAAAVTGAPRRSCTAGPACSAPTARYRCRCWQACCAPARHWPRLLVSSHPAAAPLTAATRRGHGAGGTAAARAWAWAQRSRHR